MKRLAIRIAVIALICHLYSAHVFAVEPVPQGIAPAERDRLIEEKVEKAQKELEAILKDRIDARTSTALDGRFEAAAGRLEKRSTEQFEGVKGLVKETMESFDRLVDRATWVIGILATLTAFLTGFLFFWQRKGLQDLIRQNEEKFNRLLADLSTGFREKLTVVEQEAAQKIEEYRVQFASLEQFRDKKIVWTREHPDVDASREMAAIRSKGFQVSVISPGEEESLKPEHCDFMIYSFSQSSDSVARLKEMVRFLRSTGKEIPFIVYTYNNGDDKYLNNEEKAVLREYRNYVMANMPLTLEIYFNSLVRPIEPAKSF